MHVYSETSVVSDSATLWTVACHVPLSMGFSRQEYWSGKGTQSSQKYECGNSVLAGILEEELKRPGCKSFGHSNSGGEC